MATDNHDDHFKFQGFRFPTTTPVPDELFDEVMYHLSGAELKVVLYICRRTFGFKKDSDSIALSQMVNGITKKNGEILDRGTGLGKASVARALNSLQEKGVIIRTRRSSPEQGYEPTTYSLNTLPLSQNETRGGLKMRQGLVPKRDIQQTVIQDTVNNKEIVVVEQQAKSFKNQETENQTPNPAYTALIAFGVKEHGARPIAEHYPEETILDKLAFVQWLVDQGSPLVRQNAPGFLIRAIERNIEPPNTYESPSRRKANSERQAKIESVEAEKRKEAEQEYRQAQEELRKRTRENHPPEPIGKDGLTTETAWNQTLATLEEQVTPATFETFMKHTLLLRVDGGVALIGAPSQFAASHLERYYGGIVRALGDVIDQAVTVEFVSPQTQADTDHG